MKILLGEWQFEFRQAMGQAGSRKETIKYELVDILDSVAGKDHESILVMNEDTGETKQKW